MEAARCSLECALLRFHKISERLHSFVDGLLLDFSRHGFRGSTSDYPVVGKRLHRGYIVWFYQSEAQQALLCLLAHGRNSSIHISRRIALQYILG